MNSTKFQISESNPWYAVRDSLALAVIEGADLDCSATDSTGGFLVAESFKRLTPQIDASGITRSQVLVTAHLLMLDMYPDTLDRQWCRNFQRSWPKL